MDFLYSSLVQTTKDNLQTRLDKEQSQHMAHQMKIKKAMSDMFDNIIKSDVESKMKEKASEGYNKCEIFSFEKGETFMDFPCVFLTRGPQNYNGFGLKYFDDMNIIPYIKQLQQHFAPFNVYYVTNYKTGKTSICIAWGN